MTPEKKKEYLEYLEKLSPLFDKIYDRCGQSWWSPPGEDYFFSCDMGCVEDFLNDLENWLTGSVNKKDAYSNSMLRHPPKND